MRSTKFPLVLLTAVLATMLLAAACGSSSPAADSTTTVSAMDDGAMDDDAMEDMDGMDDSAMDDGAMDDMDGMTMNMGDPNATRADEVEGAELASGDFVLLETRPPGSDAVAGTAWLARHSKGTTATLELTGLEANVAYISHIHADTCANNGGDHYQFEKGGSVMPPNEIHLAFTSDAEGNGFMTAENHAVAGPDAVALVVHPQDLLDNKIACVDFTAS